MVRKWVSFDGEILGEEEWQLSPLHSCFYCGSPLIYVQGEPCPSGILNQHEFITLCDKNYQTTY
jgi:hypothetical protein